MGQTITAALVTGTLLIIGANLHTHIRSCAANLPSIAITVRCAIHGDAFTFNPEKGTRGSRWTLRMRMDAIATSVATGAI